MIAATDVPWNRMGPFTMAWASWVGNDAKESLLGDGMASSVVEYATACTYILAFEGIATIMA